MKATIYCGTSVDGFIARLDGSVDFLDTADPPEVNGEPSDMGFEAFMASVDTLVMGRNTFDKLLEFLADPDVRWPYGDTPVVVLTSRPLDVPTDLVDQVEPAALEPDELVNVLAARLDEHLYIDGGQTAQRFLQAGLITDLIITQVPVLIGEGIELFGSLPSDAHLELQASTAFSNGMVQNHYTITQG